DHWRRNRSSRDEATSEEDSAAVFSTIKATTGPGARHAGAPSLSFRSRWRANDEANRSVGNLCGVAVRVCECERARCAPAQTAGHPAGVRYFRRRVRANVCREYDADALRAAAQRAVQRAGAESRAAV